MEAPEDVASPSRNGAANPQRVALAVEEESAPSERQEDAPSALFSNAAMVTLLVVVATGFLLADSLRFVARRPAGFDETYYLRYATSVAREGLAAFRGLVEHYVETPDERLFPPPLRLAYIAAAALWVRLRAPDFATLSWFSVWCHLTLIGVCFLGARRALGPWRACALATLCASSPLLLGLARRALADSAIVLVVTVVFWLAWRAGRDTPGGAIALVSAKRDWWFLTGALALAFLTKESALLLLGGVLVWLVLRTWRSPARKWAVVSIVVAGALAVLLWTWAAGSPGTTLRAAKLVWGSADGNAYAVAFGSGPWFRYWIDFVALAPWLTLLSLAGLTVWATDAARGEGEPLSALAASTIVGALVAFAPLTKNVRYLAALVVPLALLALVALDRLLQPALSRWRATLYALAVGVLALDGWRAFDRFFVAGGIYDPVSANLLGLLKIVPGN
jgi:4-amino-4-deoxy-L-arabinose transferase-like glycosyltransferase